jgi:DNA invertase Pin-like site-specific DNA recombinase
MKAGRKPKLTEAERRVVELTKRNAVLERKPRVANALIGLQKSARAAGNRLAPERRRLVTDLVEDLAEPDVPVSAACSALGLSRATMYRGYQSCAPAGATGTNSNFCD